VNVNVGRAVKLIGIFSLIGGVSYNALEPSSIFVRSLFALDIGEHKGKLYLFLKSEEWMTYRDFKSLAANI